MLRSGMANPLYSMAAVGERIRLTRLALRLTQAEFGQRFGVPQNAVSQYERGVKMPSYEALNEMCDAFRITSDWVLRGDNSNNPSKLSKAIEALQNLGDGQG